MQGFSSWAPPAGTLGRIVDEARARADGLTSRTDELRAQVADAPPAPAFADALRGDTVRLIAEVKRRSPSKGAIRAEIDTARQARAYADGGASALSILTEPRHFGGAPEYLAEARAAVAIPLLSKDFHVSFSQLLEARVLGASAALLIVRALEPSQMLEMARFAASVGLEVLAEVRDEDELETALQSGAGVIGVNTRNLETLEMDLGTGDRLLPLIPADRVAVWESGVSARADVERAARAGADAVLVGSSVSGADDPAAAVRALAGVARTRERRGSAGR